MKNELMRGLCIVAFGVLAAGPARQACAQVAGDTVPKAEYDNLKKQYDSVVQDRDNIAAQAKLLMEYKAKYQDSDLSIKAADGEKNRLRLDLDNRRDQIKLLQQKIDELQAAGAQSVEEKQDLKNSLEKVQIEYKMIPETRKDMARIQKENTDLMRSLKQEQTKQRQAEDQKLNAYAQSESYRRQLIDFRKRYEQALAKNRALEKKIAALPSKFAEMARENKVLIRETALMHYNLGVFYTQGKEYPRAIAEFEKAIELNPDDPYAFYNLGYIYAEYVVNRPRAIECFRHFMKLTKAEDKDLDWVKKYILTWQTWEGKKPMD